MAGLGKSSYPAGTDRIQTGGLGCIGGTSSYPIGGCEPIAASVAAREAVDAYQLTSPTPNRHPPLERRTKSRKDARQYIRKETALELAAPIATKAPGAPVVAMPSEYDTADMLRDDLAAARAKWIDAAKHDPQEHLRREQSDFLLPVNHEGETLDFHSLRHTCGAWLAMAGVHPNIVKTVMRHSTIILTMDTYGHLMPDDTADAIDKIPNMAGGEPEGLKLADAAG